MIQIIMQEREGGRIALPSLLHRILDLSLPQSFPLRKLGRRCDFPVPRSRTLQPHPASSLLQLPVVPEAEMIAQAKQLIERV
jgi:hypothetical protein